MKLTGRVAVVTGAANGIGAAIASRLAADGAKVLVVDIDAAGAERTTGEIVAKGATAWSSPMDVASQGAWEQLKDRVDELGEGLDTIVHCAFSLTLAPIHEQTVEEWDRQLAVDLSAVHRSMRSLWGHLSASFDRTGRPACILLISSVHAALSLPGYPAYGASKAGLLALCRHLSVEYGERLRVNSILPGPILTRVWDSAPAGAIELACRHTTLARMGSADEVAAAAAFLVSEEASFVTGATLSVDGGWSAERRGA